MFQGNIGHPTNHIFGAVEGRAIRQLREGHEISLILCGNESCGNAGETENGKPDQASVNNNSNCTGTQRVGHKLSVASGCAAKESIKQFEKPAEREIDSARKTVLLRPVRFQEQRSQSWA